ncbi:2OG-Fe(II) oxygenase family protein [Micromonospora sp. NPDC047074]|uniref:2OG-Fe(II) oxygenase family protein n=1 Tax=Micromonospora sp. NPDC047074 TaxID=3154339 RepID=UPI0033F18BB8
MSTTNVHDELIDTLRTATLTVDPWPHSYLPTTLPQELALRLSRSFDGFAMQSCEETEREKSYRFRTTRLDGVSPGSLPDQGWAALVDVLSGPAYRETISELTHVPLDGSELTLSLWEYQSGDWLAAHVDKPDKIVTQIFYLTESWQPGDGGRLLILDTADAVTPSRTLPPTLGASAVLVRSERSWHAVEAPATTAAHRRSVTATFWR